MIHRSILSLAGVCFFTVCLSAADISGIWVGQDQGRRGEPQDLAFRFKQDGQALSGKTFGDEFDIPISEGSISGEQIRFKVTTTNYYSGAKTVFLYTGMIQGGEIELVRERVLTPQDSVANRANAKQTFKLKRIDSRSR